MSDIKNSAGLVPDAVDLGGLTEIRVHGVGGTPPEALLGDMRPTRVAGDRIAGFYRTTDARGRHREAYSWGGLTSHSPLRVLWTPLLPSMLANMAGWMARRRVMSGDEATAEPTTRLFRWFARLAALALTLSTAIMVTMPSLDTFAYQCLGQHPCRSQLWGMSLLNVVAPYERPGVRLAAGIVAPVAVAVLFYVLASRSRTSYEGVEPPTLGASRPVPYARCAAAQVGGLRSADFWSGRRWHQHLSDLHLAAGIAVAAGTLGWCVAELGEVMDLTGTGAQVSARAASAASVVVVAVVIGMLASDDAHERLARGTLYASIIALLVSVVGALTLPLDLVDAGAGPETAAQPIGVLPGIDSSVAVGWTLTLVLLIPLMILHVAAWGIRWRKALKVVQRGPGRSTRLKSTARGSVKVFPWAAPVVLNVVALIVANAVLLSLMMLVADGLSTIEYGLGPEGSSAGAANSGGGPAAGNAVGPVLWVPKAVASIASILALGLIGVLVLFAVSAGAWLSVKSRQKAATLVVELQRDYAKAEALQGSSPLRAPGQADSISQNRRDAWTVSAFGPAPFSRERSANARPTDRRMRPSPWVRDVARMQLIGEYAPIMAAYLMIAVAGAGLLGAVLFLTRVLVFHQDPPFLNIGLATWISASLPVIYGLVLRVAFRQEKWRKVLMSPFDVGTFFPRSFHPFAPPSYTERAVPELTRRIWRLHDNQGRVVLTAHSQGSVVAAAVLARKSARLEEKTVGLVTLGSPLAKLYRWAFPALVSDGLLRSFAGGHGGIGDVRWRNVYYETDYIGGPVATVGWPASSRTDVRLLDPPTHKFVFAQPLPQILSHTGYWVDARFWQEVDSICDDIASDTLPFRARGTNAPTGEAEPPHGLPLESPAADGVAESAPDDGRTGSADTIAPDPTAPVQYR